MLWRRGSALRPETLLRLVLHLEARCSSERELAALGLVRASSPSACRPSSPRPPGQADWSRGATALRRLEAAVREGGQTGLLLTAPTRPLLPKAVPCNGLTATHLPTFAPYLRLEGFTTHLLRLGCVCRSSLVADTGPVLEHHHHLACLIGFGASACLPLASTGKPPPPTASNHPRPSRLWSAASCHASMPPPAQGQRVRRPWRPLAQDPPRSHLVAGQLSRAPRSRAYRHRAVSDQPCFKGDAPAGSPA